MKLELEPVQSSHLGALKYDEDSGVLYVQFRVRPSIYAYHDVPVRMYIELMQARSLGAYFYKYIRDRFPYEELKDVDATVTQRPSAPSGAGVARSTTVVRRVRVKATE